MTKTYSHDIRFDDHDYRVSHGKKAPAFGADLGGWAFKVYAWDNGETTIFTKGRKATEIKAEIAAIVQAPKGEIVYATIQP